MLEEAAGIVICKYEKLLSAEGLTHSNCNYQVTLLQVKLIILISDYIAQPTSFELKCHAVFPQTTNLLHEIMRVFHDDNGFNDSFYNCLKFLAAHHILLHPSDVLIHVQCQEKKRNTAVMKFS